jgi:predicted AAA+ superfamily ATPase
MRRLVEKHLAIWKTASRRKPLIVRGARQTGKTWSIETFGQANFKNHLKLDFEKRADLHSVFESDLTPQGLVSQLELLLETRIIPGETLLFFDEIQACPRALMSLRYFYEEMPDLHVISAGSLLEFALEKVPFPVGRVQFLNMYPLNFYEFLVATGKERLASRLCQPPEALPVAIHERLMKELRTFFFIGGMPECIRVFNETRSVMEAFTVQDEIIDSYRQDFAKYAPRADRACLNMILRNCAQQVGKQILYSKLAEGFSNPTIHNGFDLLNLAKVLYRIPATDPSGLPLGGGARQKKFKTALLDIGLMHRLSGMSIQKELAQTDLLSSYRGQLAEQFVAQELYLAQNSELYYWARQARNSAAEVDYLVQVRDRIVPVEVKSGRGGSLKSLHSMLGTYPNCERGIVLYSGEFADLPGQKLSFWPLYYAGHLTQTGQVATVDAATTGRGISASTPNW